MSFCEIVVVFSSLSLPGDILAKVTLIAKWFWVDSACFYTV